MITPSRAAALALLALIAACGGTNTNDPPDTTPQPQQRNGQPRVQSRIDSSRANRVIENARPDPSARAGLLVVANQEGNNATIVDAATLQTVATVPVGTGPHETAVSPDGRWAVVTNYGNREVIGNTISVIDLAATTPSVVRTINLGEYHRPHGAAFIRDGQKLLVTSETSQALVVVDFASGKVDTALATNAKGSHMVAVRRDGKRAWTANIGGGNVTEFDLESMTTVRSITAAPNDEGIATTPGGIQVWVGSNSAKTVTIIDTQRGMATDTLKGFASPYRIGISRTGRVAVVSDPENNKVWLFEIGTNRKLAELDLAKAKGVVMPALTSADSVSKRTADPEGITFDPISDFAYVTLHATNQVVAIDLNTYKVAGTGAVGTGPDGISFSPLVRKP